MFIPIQLAAIEAITGEQNCVIKTREAYQRRRDIFLKCAQEIGWNIKETKGTMFIWAKIPSLYKSQLILLMIYLSKPVFYLFLVVLSAAKEKDILELL